MSNTFSITIRFTKMQSKAIFNDQIFSSWVQKFVLLFVLPALLFTGHVLCLKSPGAKLRIANKAFHVIVNIGTSFELYGKRLKRTL